MSIQPKHQLKPVLTMCLQTNKVWRPIEAEGSLQWLLSLSQPHLFQWIHWEGCKACNRNTFWSKGFDPTTSFSQSDHSEASPPGARLVPASAALGTHHACRCDDPTVVCIPQKQLLMEGQYPNHWPYEGPRSHLMSSFHLRAVAMTQAPAIGNYLNWWPYTSTFHSKKLGPNTPKLCWPLGLSNVSNQWKKLSNSIRPEHLPITSPMTLMAQTEPKCVEYDQSRRSTSCTPATCQDKRAESWDNKFKSSNF